MQQKGKPRVSLNTLVDPDTDDRRRRLQERTGFATSRLIAEALRTFEAELGPVSNASARSSADAT